MIKILTDKYPNKWAEIKDLELYPSTDNMQEELSSFFKDLSDKSSAFASYVKANTNLTVGVEALAATGRELLLSLDEYNDFVESFSTHYALNAGGKFGRITINWSDFKEAALSQSATIHPSRLALTFIHRFSAGEWYLTVQHSEITTPIAPGSNIFKLVRQGSFFDIYQNGTITNPSTTSGTLAGATNADKYDSNYYNNLLYDEDEDTTTIPVNPPGNGIYIHSVTFAWDEFEALYTHNCDFTDSRGVTRSNSNLFGICFSSISSDFSSEPTASLIKFPHSLSMHMVYKYYHCIDAESAVAGNFFRDQAGDYNTLCPPQCPVYVYPPLP